MKLRYLTLLACALCLASAVAEQSQPTTSTAGTPPTKGPCPDTPGSKTAWFDPNLYLLRGNGVTLGRPVSSPDPQYSESARRAKIKGTVLIAAAVNTGGTVDMVKVVCSIEPTLDQNAADAVRTWKFTSATKDGTPVAVQFEVSVWFNLY